MSKKITLYSPKVCDQCGAKTVVHRVEDGGEVEFNLDLCLTCGYATETKNWSEARSGFAYGLDADGEEVLITLPFSLTNARKKVAELLARDDLELLLATHWDVLADGMDAHGPVWLHGSPDVFETAVDAIESVNANTELSEIARQLAQVWGPFEECPSCNTNAFMVEQDLCEEEDDGCNPFSDPQERTETTKQTCLVCGYEQEIVTTHRYAEAVVIARRPYQIGGVKPGYSWSTFQIEPHPVRGEEALHRWETGGHEIVLANIALLHGRLWLRGSADLFPPEE